MPWVTSVGYGDDYSAHVEGQYIDITGVAPGGYYLVHRVNADRRLLESRYANNVASVGVRITWPNGRNAQPRVQQAKVCRHSDHCPFAGRHKRGREWRPVRGQPRLLPARR